MNLSEFITPESVMAPLKVASKKQVLQDLAMRAAAQTGLEERAIFDTLVERERLGSTGVGHGIAIPHGKLKEAEKLYGLFARLAKPIDFDSLDHEPVDLVFLLLAPSEAGADHLKALAGISRRMRDEDFCAKLRGAQNESAIYALLTTEDDESKSLGTKPLPKAS